MKKINLSLIIAFMLCSQLLAAQDIFKQHGFTKEPLTLSDGSYNEFFNNDEVVQIGTVLLNTKTMNIVAFVNEESDTIYNAELSSRWLSIDPLARKYPQLSPYVYCANNPIIYIDPDGRKIVDANNKRITYSAKTGWSKNATNDIKVIYSSMMLTKTGAKQWDKAYNSPNKIEMKFSSEKLYNDKGEPALGLANQSLGYSLDGNIKTDKTMKIEISIDNINESFEGKNKGLTLREAIGATAGHEIEHTTESNRDIGIHNKNLPFATKDIEKEPEAIGKAIRDESKEMRPNKLESKTPHVEL